MAKAPRRVVSFDLETTGLNPENDAVVEVGAVELDWEAGDFGESFELLVNPGRPISQAAFLKHQISNAMIADAPPAAEGLNRLIEWIGPGSTVIAHNAAYDLRFIVAHCQRTGCPLPDWSVVDTLTWAQQRMKGAKSHKLDRLVPAKKRGLGPDTPTHRALSDAFGAGVLAGSIASGYKHPAGALRRRAKSIQETIAEDTRRRGPVSASGVKLITRRQRDYLISLGANARRIENLTREQASQYIDELKEYQESNTGSGCLVALVMIGAAAVAAAVGFYVDDIGI